MAKTASIDLDTAKTFGQALAHFMRTGPGQAADRPNEPHLPPNCVHGDPRLTPEGGWHIVLRKD
jgi:hypothetical protein